MTAIRLRGAGLASLISLVAAFTPLAAAPGNDACNTAAVIPAVPGGNLVSQSPAAVDISAADTAGDPAPGCVALANVSRSIWYKFTPPSTGSYYIETCWIATKTTVVDTVIAVYTTPDCTAFTPVACFDDATSGGAAKSECELVGGDPKRAGKRLTLTGGTEYHIAIWQSGNVAPPAGARDVQIKVTGGSVNEYADACAQDLGNGKGSRMPDKIDPYDTGCADKVEEIPVFWNEKKIRYLEVNNAGALTPGNGKWEYVFCDPANVNNCEVGRKATDPGGAFPGDDNTVGRIKKTADLKCDYWSLVNTPTGCVPGQRVVRKKPAEDEIIWTYLFRRTEPPKMGRCALAPNADCVRDEECTGGGNSCAGLPAWGEFHPYYFGVMDVHAVHGKDAIACWFDTLIAGQGGRGATTADWWRAAGGLPSGVPAPGGTDAKRKARAESFWDLPSDVAKGACTQCHGNGPLFSSRWINQKDIPTGNVKRVPARDDTKPYKNAAKLLADLEFFESAQEKGADVSCGTGCHSLWGKKSAACPGGLQAERMTDMPFIVAAPNSAFRDAATAKIKYEMPPLLNITLPQWTTDFESDYDKLAYCCTNDDPAKCSAVQAPALVSSHGSSSPRVLSIPRETLRRDRTHQDPHVILDRPALRPVFSPAGSCMPPDCDDGSACTVDDICVDGECISGAVVDCEDGDECTLDYCDVDAGCQMIPLDCDDGDECTIDSCSTLLGCEHEIVSCDDGDPCTEDFCESYCGECRHVPAICDDGDACTEDDSCVEDVCAGSLGPPIEVANDLVMPNKITLRWTLHWHDDPGTFNVYRGTAYYNHTCLAPAVSGNSASVVAAPPAGTVFYYLVSRRSGCGESILGTGFFGTIPNPSPCM